MSFCGDPSYIPDRFQEKRQRGWSASPGQGALGRSYPLSSRKFVLMRQSVDGPLRMIYRVTISMCALFGVVFSGVSAILAGRPCDVRQICSSGGSCCEPSDINASACCCRSSAQPSLAPSATDSPCPSSATARGCCPQSQAPLGLCCPCQCCRSETPPSDPVDPKSRQHLTDEFATLAPAARRRVLWDGAEQPTLAAIAEWSTRAKSQPIHVLFCVWTE